MSWLSGLKRYLLLIVIGNLIWEFVQMPLYTLWLTGTPSEIVFAAFHYTGGDILIAMSALLAARRRPLAHRAMDRSTDPRLLADGSSERSTMNFQHLKYAPTIVTFAASLFLTTPAAPAQSGMPLIELLRSTHIHGIAVDRADSGRLLIATHHGLHALRLATGIVEPVSERRDDFMGFTPHPSDATKLYASGHPARGGNLGFIASTDGGRTWTMLSPGVGGPVDFHQMDVSKADPSIIYGVFGGLQVSRDSGRNWRHVGPVPEGLIALAASFIDPERLYAATEQGLLISENGGHAWKPAHLLRRPFSMIKVATDGSIYAFMLGSGLLRAEEPSLAWQTLSNDFGDSYLLHFTVDPKDPARLYASTHRNELLSSDDGGRTWRQLGAP